MFLGLTASTALAETLGLMHSHAFENDFCHNASDPVVATRGEIYQYVGDEVVVTWRVRNGWPTGDAVRCFFLIGDAVEANASRYQTR